MTTSGQNVTEPIEPLIESGEAFRRLGGLQEANRDRFDVIVIGGGQAGLSVGYHLRKRGLRFVILDASDRIGDVWRQRWDSLRLFTPAKLDGLAGMRFPAHPDSFPSKDQMADYLEAYAARFELPVRTRSRVDRLFKRDGVFVVKIGDRELTADQVVVAMASYQQRRVPSFARELRADIVQLHSSEYRTPAQLRPGAVLIVGAGNSGAEIAAELVRGLPVVMSGRDTGEVPFRIDGWAGRTFLARFVLRVVFHRILTVKTPMGRKARPRFISRGTPLIRVRSRHLSAAGVQRVPRITGARDGLPVAEDGRVLDVANVVWCTGFHPGFSWIDLPIPRSDGDGEPIHDGGVVTASPGLYFVGLHFLYAVSSTMIHGVGRDAERIARAIQARHAAHQGSQRW
ncbi:MAG TPA: FAD-dependent oxidoreductase [Polyangia bacterium]|jgi:putative flavoprotein involved in K+ transport|nr:FAD-dependent oxidoreductase [Polyangia bacterium]